MPTRRSFGQERWPRQSGAPKHPRRRLAGTQASIGGCRAVPCPPMTFPKSGRHAPDRRMMDVPRQRVRAWLPLGVG
jgi:hypothetical protein